MLVQAVSAVVDEEKWKGEWYFDRGAGSRMAARRDWTSMKRQTPPRDLCAYDMMSNVLM